MSTVMAAVLASAIGMTFNGTITPADWRCVVLQRICFCADCCFSGGVDRQPVTETWRNRLATALAPKRVGFALRARI